MAHQIDSAAVYKNEAGCGAAIRKLASTVPRDQIFFTSKVPGRTLSYENTKAQVDKTLEETGLDYVDLMLLHAPVSIFLVFLHLPFTTWERAPYQIQYSNLGVYFFFFDPD